MVKNYDIDAKDVDGRSVLHYAAYFCDDESIITYLLEHNAQTTQDNYSFYPIYYAVLADKLPNASLVKLNLIKLIEKVEKLTDNSPCTSIMHVIANKDLADILPVVLEKYDCSSIPYDENGVTPIHIAAASGNM
ncbi:hypothetical protein RF11_02254 [Thelohanellus kitauei]|uniref:Uncharacterized protein n=1 Tax=Thelohanellus kitauei TaxID=669202 RepID=A0A0C2M8X9_THEKT|nr:hypothetical protein RF11_02254 [Thelohanellus kitauei]